MDKGIVQRIVDNHQFEVYQMDRLYDGEGRNYSVVDDNGHKYILKVHRSEKEELVAFVTTVLNFLKGTALGIQFPHPVKNRKGRNYTRHSGRILVVLGWIEGRTLKRIGTRGAQALGEAVCILDDKLRDFYDTHEMDYTEYEDSIWNVANIHQYDADLETIEYLLGGHYGLIKDTITHFDEVYPAIQRDLGKSLIHNDVNPYNLLYNQNRELSGIIDFTELCHGHRISEVGIALAYLLQMSGDNGLRIGQSFIKGYANGYPFTAAEQNYLLMMIKLRLSLSIIYNTMRQHVEKALTPIQAQFIDNSKRLLAELATTTEDEFGAKVFSAA